MWPVLSEGMSSGKQPLLLKVNVELGKYIILCWPLTISPPKNESEIQNKKEEKNYGGVTQALITIILRTRPILLCWKETSAWCLQEVYQCIHCSWLVLPSHRIWRQEDVRWFVVPNSPSPRDQSTQEQVLDLPIVLSYFKSKHCKIPIGGILVIFELTLDTIIDILWDVLFWCLTS